MDDRGVCVRRGARVSISEGAEQEADATWKGDDDKWLVLPFLSPPSTRMMLQRQVLLSYIRETSVSD